MNRRMFGWKIAGILLLSSVLVAFIFFGTSSPRKQRFKSQLDHLIPPEVKDDLFYQAIYRMARDEPVNTILEIGSSSGEGSTEAFVLGIRENPQRPTLFCVEVSRRRFAKLKEHYQQEPQVRCYNVSSISTDKFPQESEVCHFYNTTPSKLNQTPLPIVLSWLKQDIDYIKREDVPQQGIELIQKENRIAHFDMVLIDGSEFAGIAELDQIYGAKFIFLDDICTFKNFLNRKRLLNDPNYTLVEENLEVRNGYAIFKRVGPFFNKSISIKEKYRTSTNFLRQLGNIISESSCQNSWNCL